MLYLQLNHIHYKSERRETTNETNETTRVLQLLSPQMKAMVHVARALETRHQRKSTSLALEAPRLVVRRKNYDDQLSAPMHEHQSPVPRSSSSVGTPSGESPKTRNKLGENRS